MPHPKFPEAVTQETIRELHAEQGDLPLPDEQPGEPLPDEPEEVEAVQAEVDSAPSAPDAEAEDAGVAGETATDAAQEVPRSPAIPQHLVTRAINSGWSYEDALAYASPEHLERALNHWDRRVGQKLMEQQQRPVNQPPPQPVPAPLPPVEEFKLELTEAEADPKVIETLNKLHGYANQRIQQANQQAQTAQQELAQLRGEIMLEKLDRFVESLGPEWQSVFGKGDTLELDPQSAGYRNRDELAKNWMAFRTSAMMSGGPPPSHNVLLRRAHAVAFAEQAAKINAKKAAQAKPKLTNASLKPTARKPAPPVRDRKAAVAFIADYNRKKA